VCIQNSVTLSPNLGFDISAKDGALILGGSIPADELNELFSCVLGVWAREKK
jgi:hypothetical protein